MERRSILLIAFHGVLLIAIGMLVGIPFTNAVTGDAGADLQRARRVSHTSLLSAGTLYVAIAAVGQHPVLSSAAASFVTRTFVVAAWALSVAFVVGPIIGARGLEPTGPPLHILIFVLFTSGLLALFASLVLVLRGLFFAYREDGS